MKILNYLSYTCVLSEFTRKRPEELVINWLDRIDEDMMFLSVVLIRGK
ncbi:MAG: hypothetical protein JEZ06_11050 [Anaerolineaceae bacterium]|nr:hypothetical protein [Anaerolineaceae bacterium]